MFDNPTRRQAERRVWIGRVRQPMSTPHSLRAASDSNISLAELRDRLNDPNLTIVDVRPLPAFNGWRATGTPRGGHNSGAGPLPSNWVGILDEGEGGTLPDSQGDLFRPGGGLYRQ